MSPDCGGLPPEVPLGGHFLVTVRERVRIFTPELQLRTRAGQGYNSASEAKGESEGRDRQVFPSFSYNRCEPSHVSTLTLSNSLDERNPQKGKSLAANT